MNRSFLGVLLMVVLMAGACNKKKPLVEPDTTEKGDAKMVLTSGIADSVYITLSGVDILTGTIPHILNYTLAGNDTLALTRAELKSAHRYKYSWRSADYKYGSWLTVNTDGKPLDLYFDYYVSHADDTVNLVSPNRNEMLIFLDGNGNSSTWEAVDAYDATGTSVWATLTDIQKKHAFVVNRYHVVKHSFTDNAGKANSTNLAFSMDFSQSRTWLTVRNTADSFVLTNDLTGIAPLSTIIPEELFYVRTTISGGVGVQVPPYYKLVRRSVEK